MNGDPERLVKEYKRDEDKDEALAYGVLEIFGIQHTGADLSDDLETVRMILEGVEVLSVCACVSSKSELHQS
ncbi:hypothetical protein OJAV_G00096720 [Oryzias javanicus]|uniref:Uncharacterized protein n=1 Tax=Oryzias javanicus TaxID=123683 RepID=A0A437D1K1_ORYJA|nr:hypothetical protein OJAV_G00096720 [Oryzias javanicus]